MAAKATIQTTRATTKSPIAAMPSRPRIHAAASAPHVSAKSATTTTCTTQVDIAPDCRLAERVVREPRVDPPSAVHELGHAQVDDDAREGERLASLEPVLATHELEHPVDRDRGRLVEVLVEAERQPGVRRPGDRAVEREGRRARESVSCARSTGASIASCETSPSPWAACPSPAERSAPSTGIGR